MTVVTVVTVVTAVTVVTQGSVVTEVTVMTKKLFFCHKKNHQTKNHIKKSCIRKTKHPSTDAESSTDTTKPQFFLKNGKNHAKRKTSKMSRNMPQLAKCPLTRGL